MCWYSLHLTHLSLSHFRFLYMYIWAMRPILLHITIYAFIIIDIDIVFYVISDVFFSFFSLSVWLFAYIHIFGFSILFSHYFWFFFFRLHLFGSTIYGWFVYEYQYQYISVWRLCRRINFGIIPKRQLKIPSIMRHINNNENMCAYGKIRILFRILCLFRCFLESAVGATVLLLLFFHIFDYKLIRV